MLYTKINARCENRGTSTHMPMMQNAFQDQRNRLLSRMCRKENTTYYVYVQLTKHLTPCTLLQHTFYVNQVFKPINALSNL